jgi:hypothetical protein
MYTAQLQRQQELLPNSTTAAPCGCQEKQQQQQDVKLMASRAAAGDLQGLQWLVSQGCIADNASICTAAAKSGQLDMLCFLRHIYPPCSWNLAPRQLQLLQAT